MKELCVAKTLVPIGETFLYENNCNFNLYKFTDKLAFIPLLSFCMSQKQESIFWELGGLVVTKDISVFCL